MNKLSSWQISDISVGDNLIFTCNSKPTYNYPVPAGTKLIAVEITDVILDAYSMACAYRAQVHFNDDDVFFCNVN